MRLLFLLNPRSGGSDKEAWEEGITARFPPGSSYTTWVHRMEEDADCKTAFAEAVEAFRPDRVGAIGGDGTLKLAAEVLEGTGIPVAFLPAGSANGMARELDLPTDVDACLNILAEGAPTATDAVRINGHLSLHLADMGLNARLVKYFEEDAAGRGMVGYARQVARAIRDGRRMRLAIHADGRTLHRSAWMVILANGRSYGTGAAVNPDGSLTDGRFEVVILRRRWFAEMLRMLLLRRPTEDRTLTEIFPVQKLSIRTRRAAHFQVDGEYLGRTSSVEAEVVPGAVHILMPAPDGEKV